MISSELEYGRNDERVLVLLMESRDSASIPRVLERIGVPSMMCSTPEETCAEIDKGAGALLIEEEILSIRMKESLVKTLDSQPPWSELPIIVLLRRGPETEASREALLLPGDVTLVERPVRVNTLVAIVNSALRSRRRQYMMRDQLQALEESESRYRTLFDSIDEGFCIIEVIFDESDKPIDYRFLETNPSFQKQTGLSNAQGKRLLELVPKLEAHWFEIYGRIALTGQPARFQRWAEPLHRWYDVYAFRFGHQGNRQVAVLFTDITDSKRAEEDREGLIADLERSNNELEQFAYVASHDLQEPLRMVASYVQLLARRYRDQLDERAETYIKFALDGTVRMQNLINALLAYSRLSRTSEVAAVDMNLVFENALKNLAVAIRENQAVVTKDDLPTVLGDETQLTQLFQNLVGNAIKYRKPDRIARVHVSAMAGEGESVFFVRDNGIGIAPEHFGKIFQIFQRLHTRDEYLGTGIGLASCKKIVERHHGRIWIESTPGAGSTFFFSMPVAERT